MAFDLKALWGYDDLIANPPSYKLGIDQDDIRSLYIIRKLNDFKENIHIL